MRDPIERQAAIDLVESFYKIDKSILNIMVFKFKQLPSAQPEDYMELKREFIRMAEYVDLFLVCDSGQKETLIGFISRLAEFMPWTERD